MMEYQSAIDFFEQKKMNFDAWYMSRVRVSLADICERDEFMKKCDFAISMLKEAGK